MPEYVLQGDCESKHRAFNWFTTTSMALMSLFIIVVGWSGYESQTAKAEAVKAQIAIEVANGTNMERHIAIAEKLDDIRASQIRTDNRLDQFYRRNGGSSGGL